MKESERNSILLKIRKLLDLKDSAEKIGSEGEAYAAARAVRRLLLKYNLSLVDVENAEEGTSMDIEESEPVSYRDRFGLWKRDLQTVLCQFNFCQGLMIGASKRMTIVGEKHNVTVVKELYEYLCATFRRLSKTRFEAWVLDSARDVAEYGAKKGKYIPLHYIADSIRDKEEKTFMTSYFKGCVDGLYDQYLSMQATTEEKSLTVTHKKAIGDFLDGLASYSGRTFHPKKDGKTYDKSAYFAGVDDGKNVSLNKQIKHKDNKLIS